jgi:ketosteroid isomerase-like protein
MRDSSISRRALLEAGACALAASAGLPAVSRAGAGTEAHQTNEEIIRRYYRLWSQQNDWHPVDALLTDDFTFTSPVDDHISKSAFKTGCWDTQHALIAGHDLERVFVIGDQAFVRYACRTKHGKSFRNVEYLQLKDGRIEAIECYFGGSGYPSAANKGQKAT